jgi:hypothetical protein
MLTRTLFQLAICSSLLAGCINPAPVSLAYKQFRLIKVTFDKLTYAETVCQFGRDKVEIWKYRDAKKRFADLTVGHYSVRNKFLKLPFGEFETTRAKDGYYLYADGKLTYKLVFNGMTQ